MNTGTRLVPRLPVAGPGPAPDPGDEAGRQGRARTRPAAVREHAAVLVSQSDFGDRIEAKDKHTRPFKGNGTSLNLKLLPDDQQF